MGHWKCYQVLSIIKLPPPGPSSDELVPSGWLSADLWFKRQFFFPLTSFSPVHWQKFFFYQWDVCVGRKADGCEEISKFQVGLQELRLVQGWVSLAAASHSWKIILCAKLFPSWCGALPWLGQLCLPWAASAWGRGLGAALEGLGIVLGQNLPLNCFFSWGCQPCAASQ